MSRVSVVHGITQFPINTIIFPNNHLPSDDLQLFEPAHSLAASGLHAALHRVEICPTAKSTRLAGHEALAQGREPVPEVPGSESRGGTGCARKLVISNTDGKWGAI